MHRYLETVTRAQHQGLPAEGPRLNAAQGCIHGRLRMEAIGWCQYEYTWSSAESHSWAPRSCASCFVCGLSPVAGVCSPSPSGFFSNIIDVDFDGLISAGTPFTVGEVVPVGASVLIIRPAFPVLIGVDGWLHRLCFRTSSYPGGVRYSVPGFMPPAISVSTYSDENQACGFTHV